MFTTLPEDVYYSIYKIYFDTHVLIFIPFVKQNSWMWKCSDKKKNACTERGAIQLGYTYNDAWSRVYVSSINPFCTCHLSSKACRLCIYQSYAYTK